MSQNQFSPWPCYSLEEAEAVKNILLSNKVNYWTGDQAREFEREYATFTGSDFAIALANGTVALDLALRAIDLKPGDEVIVTPRTFLASVSSIVLLGGVPIFADVDPNSQNITAETIARVLSPKTRAVMCVHLAGWPCDMEPIMHLAKKCGFFVIEDCAQSHGAVYKGQPVGSIGDIGCWSFCQDKIMTTGGEGGMVTTNSRDLWSKMWSFKDHGKSLEAVYELDHPPGFRWLHSTFGSNFRITEMQSVIGRIQLEKMPKWRSTRQKYAKQIWSAASKFKGLRVPKFYCTGCNGSCEGQSGCEHAAYKCYVFVDGNETDRDNIMRQINERGVPCYTGSCSEVYLEKAFDGTGLKPKQRLTIAKQLGETSLMFLCHPTLTQDEIDKTCNVLEAVTDRYFT